MFSFHSRPWRRRRRWLGSLSGWSSLSSSVVAEGLIRRLKLPLCIFFFVFLSLASPPTNTNGISTGGPSSSVFPTTDSNFNGASDRPPARAAAPFLAIAIAVLALSMAWRHAPTGRRRPSSVVGTVFSVRLVHAWMEEEEGDGSFVSARLRFPFLLNSPGVDLENWWRTYGEDNGVDYTVKWVSYEEIPLEGWDLFEYFRIHIFKNIATEVAHTKSTARPSWQRKLEHGGGFPTKPARRETHGSKQGKFIIPYPRKIRSFDFYTGDLRLTRA